MPEVSIIVPVYNVEKYIARCVNSILGQTYSDFELLLINDGSTDSSGMLCEEFAAKDDRISVIHQKNAGQAAAKNAGLDRCYSEGNSKWIVFLDSDDWVHPAYLERLLSVAIENSAEIAVCGLVKTDGLEPVPSVTSFPVQCYSPEEVWLKDRLVATIPVCKICSKRVFQGYRFPVGRVHEDEFVLYRVLFACDKIAFIEAPLYYYYQNPDGVSLQKKWTPARADSLEAFSAQCSFFHAGGYYRAERLSAKGLFVGCAEVLTHMTSLYPEEKKLIRRFRALFRRVRLRYHSSLDFSMVGSKKNYDRLAHPHKMKLKRKWKHLILFLQKGSHG